MFPHFPEIDVGAHDFDMEAYATTVRAMMEAADIPLTPFHITWSDLNCTVPVQSSEMGITNVISMFQGIFNAVQHGFAALSPTHHHDANKEEKEADVLHEVSGYVKPGQMLLVLGTSGSGTSLLLKRLADRHMPTLMNSSGEVLYEGLSKLGGKARPTHATHFIQQYDNHIPSLTVRHTLQFAAECRWPAWLPWVNQLRANDVLITAKVLGISRTLDTIVGSDILRGVSGGERKRVTIGEMGIGLVAGSLIMDNWSKGLDSATTLSITRSMRDFANLTEGCVVVSMQAPGSDVFNLFDNVCLMDKGRVMYFGPTSEVESYLNTLGFSRPSYRSVPDYVATITDDSLRHQYISKDTDDLESPRPLPKTAEEFEQCYMESSYYTDVVNTIEDVKAHAEENRVEIKPHIAKLGAKKVVQGPFHQLKALTRRQARYYYSTRADVFAELLQELIFGLLLGSIFWQLPDTLDGARSRGGIIFLTVLFIGFGSLASVQTKFDEKIIFAKQRDSSFFSAWTYLLCQACFDFIIELVKSVFLIVPLFFMSGLSIGASGQRLMYAIIVATFVSLTMVSIVRFFVGLFDDPNAAQGIIGLLFIIMVLFTGYMKSAPNIQDWLIWLYWMNPLHYAFEALMINEFEGLKFACNSTPDAFDPCLIQTGEQYIAATVGITEDKIYRLYFFIIVVSYNFTLFILSAITTALSKPSGHAKSSSAKTEKNENTRMSETIIDMSEVEPTFMRSTAFTFQNLLYKVQDGAKVLLTNVTGNAVSGKVVLLMGESGAGKTTLLDVCALRKTLKGGASLDGDIRLNGVPVNAASLASASGYCEQNDLHIGEATVREALMFSANLRLPKTMTLKQKKHKVQDTITELGLEPFSDVLVKALGSGELKLLTMGVEIVANPKVLFLDEPTSGISSSSAMVVAKVLQNIAATGTCVICTVHQPSREVFTMFDRLLLLKRGGKTVYFGDIGRDGRALRKYFEGRGAPKMDITSNPADWMLDVIADESVDWVEEWNNSEEKRIADAETAELSEPINEDDLDGNEKVVKNKPGIVRQTRDVIARQFWRYWRLPEYNTTRVILVLMIALIVGLFYLGELDDTQTGAMLIFSAIFLTIIPNNLAAQNVVDPTASGRAVFYREIAAGLYKPIAHHIAVGLVEIPFSFVAMTVFSVVFYFMVGLQGSRFFYFFLANQLLYTFAVMFGVMMAVITPNPNLARMLASSIFSLLIVLSGFFITKPEMPVWWRWSVWINPFAYYLSGTLVNQLQNTVFRCTDDQYTQFELPGNYSSCEDIGEAFETAPGSTLCRFCQVPSGQVLIDQFSADDVNKWVALVALIVGIVVVRSVTAVGFSKLRFLTR